MIVGAGPAGMMLAAELALADVDAVVVERRPDHVLADSRAGGFHARTLEVFDQRGVVDRFLAEGRTVQAAMFGTTTLDMGDFPTRHPYSLALWQKHIERIMAGWLGELGVAVHHGAEVAEFAQDGAGVDVRLVDGRMLHTGYLVGCDGGRSGIRKAAGIAFPGWAATRSNLIAEVELTEEPPAGLHQDDRGVHALHRMEDGRTFRVVVTEREVRSGSEATLEDLSRELVAVFGTDFGVHDATWISRFSDATRQAAAYRSGRVLLAGDSAHVHYPAGGQVLSLGLQDAVNLGWKLAQVVKGISPDGLLDTYHAERHPVAARALAYTMAQGVLQRRDDRMAALAGLVSQLAGMDEPHRLLAGLVSGLDIRYDLGDGHPLLGRRMPDLDLTTPAGPVRVFELLHRARPVLLRLDPPAGAHPTGWEDFTGWEASTGWGDRVQLVEATCAGPWELPVVGPVDAPTAVLVRPDGYVAWVGDGTAEGLEEALSAWFGPRRPTTT